MNPPRKLTDPAARPAGLRRPGLARAAWVAVAALALSLFVATLPAQYAELRALAEAARPHVARIGLTVEDYTAYQLALNILVALVFCGVGATIFVRKASSRMALLVSLVLILIGAWFPIRDLAEQQAGLRFPIECLSYVATVAFLTLFYLFPDGRFVPRWTRVLAPIFAILELPYTFFPNASQSAFTLPPLFATLAWVGWLATCVFAQVYRYLRVSDPEQRQQTKWVVFGMTAAIVGSLLLDAPRQIYPSLQQPGAL